MKRDKYALLVVDMQLVAFDGKITAPIVHGSKLLDKVSKLIEICRAENVPIVFLQTCAFSGQPYAKDVHGWEIHPDVAPTEDDRVVYKVESNGFEDTHLHDVLTEIGAKTLITCGIWSEYCVTATSKAALDLGYKVWVVAHGHGTVADSDHEACRIVTKQNEYLAHQKALVFDEDAIKAKFAEV